jgi:biotin carboxyl carrier protein
MQHDKIAISERTRQGYRDFFKKQFTQQLTQLSQQLHNTQQLIDQLNGQIKYSETLVEPTGNYLRQAMHAWPIIFWRSAITSMQKIPSGSIRSINSRSLTRSITGTKNKKMRSINYTLSILILICVFIGCRSGTPEHAAAEDSTAAEGATPVTVTEPTTGNMSETVELNAVSSYRLKTFVKSNANGYLQSVNAELGRYVTKGQELFVVRTKESQSLGNTITKLDTSLHFDGSIHIKSPGTGFITQINYRSGDYVQDGEQLLTITDTRSFVFILSLPYELRPYLAGNKNLQVVLPDKTVLDGHIEMAMPTVDSVSQTQNFVIG